jgi:ubiquinone biosynthesis protein COQ9
MFLEAQKKKEKIPLNFLLPVIEDGIAVGYPDFPTELVNDIKEMQRIMESNDLSPKEAGEYVFKKIENKIKKRIKINLEIANINSTFVFSSNQAMGMLESLLQRNGLSDAKALDESYQLLDANIR